MEKLLLTIIPYILYRYNIYGFNILPLFLLEHHSFTPSQYSWQKKNNCISTDPNLPFPSPQHRVLQYCSTNHPHATLLPHTHIHITLKVKLRQTRLEQKNALADNRHNPKERNGGELRLLHRILVTTMAENYQSLLSFPRQETYGQQTHGLLRHFCKTYVCLQKNKDILLLSLVTTTTNNATWILVTADSTKFIHFIHFLFFYCLFGVF